MKNFIICGASRTGKSILSKKLSMEFGLSHLVGDAIVSSLEDTFPETGIQMHGNPVKVANKLETFFSYLIWNYNYEGIGCVLDTVHLRPDNILKIREKNGFIPCIFMGYPTIDPLEKLHLIREHDPKEDFWSVEWTDEELLTHIKNHIAHAQMTQKACLERGIPYIDASEDFDAAQEAGYNNLVRQMTE